MAANAIAETILAFHGGGGSWPEAAALASAVLDVLENADSAASSRIGLYFLWHWAGILGLRHEFSLNQQTAVNLDPGAVQWLKKIDTLPASGIINISLDPPSFLQAKNYCQAILAGALGKSLYTWDGI